MPGPFPGQRKVALRVDASMSTIIESIEQRQLKKVPRFEPGDRVRVHFQVVEGTRRRTQVFEGIVDRPAGRGARETFTVRKQSSESGSMDVPSALAEDREAEVVARGDVRRRSRWTARAGRRVPASSGAGGSRTTSCSAEADEVAVVDSAGVSQEEAETVLPEEGEEGDGADEEAAARPTSRGSRGDVSGGRGARR